MSLVGVSLSNPFSRPSARFTPNIASGSRGTFRIEPTRSPMISFRSAGAPLDDPRWAMLNLIEPAVWSVNKTEAIDPISDFWWIDDDPTQHDRTWLRSHNRQDRLIEVSSDRDPDALLHARALLDEVGASLRAGLFD